MTDDFGSDLGDDLSSNVKSKGGISIKWENVLPIIVIVLVLLLVLFKTNIFSEGLPFLNSNSSLNVLHIGNPSVEFRSVLNDAKNRDLIQNIRFLNVDSFENNPYNRIKDYDLIILDQSNQTDKSISRTLGEAITSYVNYGGKLIVVLNSGITRANDYSVMGWKATFGDIMPVGCDNMIYGVPSCNKPYAVSGTIYRADEDHPIMEGIQRVPALDTYGLLTTKSFDITLYGNEIAYFEDERTNKVFPAIVEKNLSFGGNVIYFNYNPGLSNEIFVKTLKYLS